MYYIKLTEIVYISRKRKEGMGMALWQALLVGLLGYFGVNRTPWFFGQAGGFFGIAQPIVACTIMGILFGDVQSGVLVGVALQALYLGVIQPGGALPSDKGFATFIGGSLAIASGGGVEAALALAVPLGLLGVALFQFFMTVNAYFPHMGDRAAAEGDGNKVAMANVLGTVPTFVVYVTIYTMANYLGVGFVQGLLDILPAPVLATLSIVGKIVPAVGFAMLMKYVITKGKEWMLGFFAMGFVLVKNTSFNIVALALFSIGLAIMFVMARYGKDLSTDQTVAATVAEGGDDDDEYDE